MGNPYLLQACLRLPKEQIPTNLELGEEFTFSKKQHRLYQLNVPMDLRDKEWNFYARVIVTTITIGDNQTTGTFIPVKLFSKEEKQIISKAYVSDEEVQKAIIQDSTN